MFRIKIAILDKLLVDFDKKNADLQALVKSGDDNRKDLEYLLAHLDDDSNDDSEKFDEHSADGRGGDRSERFSDQ